MQNTDILEGKCLLCDGSLSNCQIIDTKDFLTKIKGSFRYKRCDICGSFIQSPMPSQEFLNNCYQSQSLGYFQPPKINNLLNSYRLANRPYFQRFLYHVFPKLKTVDLMPEQPAPARVLEIGSSYGARLYGLKKSGYTVTGVELNDEMVNFARDQLHLDLRKGQVENTSFQNHSFDIIIMSMVLEHCIDPQQIIVLVKQWLRPGGELLLSLPCSDGFEFRIFKGYCYMVHPPYHIFLPSLLGISTLLKPFFEIKEMGFQFFHRDLVASASFAYSVKSNSLYYLLARIGNITMVQRIIRCVLLILTTLGLRTSRVSLRCIKGIK